jgi:hypothetical protein
MKKTNLLFLAVFIAAIVMTLVSFTQDGSTCKNTLLPDQNAIPDSISAIFTKSCYACHSESSTSFAKSMLNFSEWNTLGAKKQVKLGSAICSKVTKGAMPPGSFLEKNPTAKLTTAQVDSICAWTKTLKVPE